jgi:integrase
MTVSAVLNSAGGVAHRLPCSGSTPAGHLVTRVRYSADPPTVDEIIAVMDHASDSRHGWRLRALIKCHCSRRALSARHAGRGTTAVRATSAASRQRPELALEGVPLNIIQRQLGHANLGTTSIHLQGIDTKEISPPSTDAPVESQLVTAN